MMPPTQPMILWISIKVSVERPSNLTSWNVSVLILQITAGTAPEPADLVQSRKPRISLPPRATSPIKTHLNSSPRRSMPRSVGPMSSPSRNLNGTPTRATSHPPIKPVNRLLDFSPERSRESVERASSKASSSKLRNGRLGPSSSKGRGNRNGPKVFDLTGGTEDSETEALDEPSKVTDVVHQDESIMPDGGDDLIVDSGLDSGLQADGNMEDQSQDLPDEDIQSMGPPATTGANEKTRRPGRPPTISTVDQDRSQVSALEPQGRKRGRPPGWKKTQVYQEPDISIAPQASPQRGRPKAPLSVRDPNLGIRARKNSRGKPSSRAPSTSRFIHRSETPAADGGIVTRAGRQVFKPLASWRGEKAIMSDWTSDSLPGVKEIVRVEEVIEPRPKSKSYSRRARRAKPRLADLEEEEEEPEDERASWELDPGIMVAQVMDWDPETNKYDEDSTRDEGMFT